MFDADSEETVVSQGSITTRPFVSVVIPHYNDLARLRVCHGRLVQQSWPRNQFEIVVADNNSSCGLAAVQAAASSALVVPAPIQGAGPARNAGVAASHGSVIAFIDSDCVPELDWIAEGVAALARFDFAGGRVGSFAQFPERPTSIEAYEIVFNFNFRRYIETVGFTGTGNMFVPRDTFDRVGGFRAVVAEDMEWSFRARALGYRLGYAERAGVGHPARRSWKELEQRWDRMLHEDFALILEQHYGRTRFALKALAMPASVLPHAAKVMCTADLPSLGAKLGAIGVLTRLRLWRAARMLRLVFDNMMPRTLRPETRLR
ncbi:MAG TPA: glycosyltransferase [Acetobacteraceae bacterium]|jgi:glycosyltransferase involved in cell wall biosynthesis|nr:glycosyltransferase [Acetobacteraceae bacterium]